jgi:threonine/homoserine/homoserine lactone efflux protein
MTAIALLAGFAMAFLGSMAPTGPIAVLVLQRSVLRKYGEGMAIAVGCAIAEGGYAALAVSGLSILFARYPVVELVARIAGVAILVGLGIQFVRFRAGDPPPELDAEQQAAQDKRGVRRAFGVGFGISAANPVLIITWSTSVAMLYSFAGLRFGPLARAAFALGVSLGVIGWLWTMVALIRRFSDRVTLKLAERIVRVSGAAMIAMAVFFGGSLLWRSFG